MSDALSFLTSSEQIQANYDKYKDMFKDSTKELVNSETFLNLLVAEMTNQDPLEPTSNTEFVSQMAQFTQLSYAQDSSTYAKANYAASLVGKTVTASRMEGSEQITKTGVVEQVVKNGDTYSLTIDGVKFEIKHIQSVSDTAGASGGANAAISGSSLGDTISRASMMIGMHATVNAKTEKGDVLDAGVIESIQVKNGEVNVVINGIGYKLSDVIEVKYPEVEIPEPSEDVPAVDESSEAEELTEMLEELMPDEEAAEDIEDLVDDEEPYQVRYMTSVFDNDEPTEN